MINLIIPCFNKIEYTRKCLWSVYRYADPERFRVMVINDGSVDETEKFLIEFVKKYNNIGYINSKVNRGFVKSVNDGIKYYLNDMNLDNKDIIGLLNNDVEINGEWIDDIINILIDGKIGSIGPIGHKQLLNKEVTFVSNSRSFFRAEIFRKIGLLDVKIIYGYYDDVDMSIRLLKAGYEVKKHVIPSEHAMGTSFKQIDGASHVRIRNKQYVEKKHKEWLLSL